ncbi:uncharacterized protein LOC122504770 [Leptopilina heterotoma]|uniref:uncharacterized protein LOC122504770 n=1 Tax=Leptopilina heterotoma TaxID=63436 RepID=UPI001CA86C3B|nr:uncharacterized protein LOC122504770 [Leptopilina heterotoma]
MTKSEKDLEIISGDGLRLRKDCNKNLLEIKGDGCRITIGRNFGTIRMIGDGCRLKVIKNIGSIEYKGDGGRVDLGPDSIEDKVTFIGHGSHVKYFNEKSSSSSSSSSRSSSPKLTKSNQSNQFSDKINLQNQTKNNITKNECNFESENQYNERRERSNVSYSEGSTMIVTKIILDSNGKCHTNIRTICKNVNTSQC